MNIGVYDIETNGLGLDCTIHSVAIKPGTGKTKCFTSYQLSNSDGNLPQAKVGLLHFDLLVGFNNVAFDQRILEHQWECKLPKQLDLMIVSKLMFSKDQLFDIDRGIPGMPPALWGRHSLEAFGWRMGERKLEFKEWHRLSSEMVTYNKQDVETTYALYEFLRSQDNYPLQEVIDLEHRVMEIIAEQSHYGFYLDYPAVRELNIKLMYEQRSIETELRKTFKPRFVPKGPVKVSSSASKKKIWLPDDEFQMWTPYTPYESPIGKMKNGKIKFPKKRIKWSDTPLRLIFQIATGEYQPIEYKKFEPGSRHQIRSWLKFMYDFEFPTFTEKGTPKVEVDSLKSLGEKGELLSRYLKVSKDISQLSTGEGSLIKNYRPESSTVTSHIDTNGTVTGRFTSSSVNLNQIPAQKEFRKLFAAPEGWSFVGVDFSQQELVNLAHYLYPYDGGAYAHTVATGKKEDGTDPHSLTQKMGGLPTRDLAKVFGFQFLYGAGEVKNGASLLKELLDEYTPEEYQIAKDKVYSRSKLINGSFYFPIGKDEYIPVTELVFHQAIYGRRVMEKFTSNLPGLKELVTQLTLDSEKGFITIPSGRVLPIRHKHAALNTHLQGLGGVAMKTYLVTIHEQFAKAGLKHGRDFIQQATIYDEVDFIAQDRFTEEIAHLLEEAFPMTSKKLGLNANYSGNAMIGKNWAECH